MLGCNHRNKAHNDSSRGFLTLGAGARSLLRKMKVIRTSVLVLTAILISSAAVSAQGTAAGKVGLINMEALAAKDGATRFINALTALDKEFETELKDLQALSDSINTKTQELQKLAEQARQPNSPVSNEALRQRNDELEGLKRQFTFKQEDLQARINSRRQVVVGPIYAEVRVALRDYALQKGYSMILDGGKLEEAGLLMAFDTKYDVTKDFVTFFNARPAGTAPASQ